MKAGLDKMKGELERLGDTSKEEHILYQGKAVSSENAALNIAKTSHLNLGGHQKNWLWTQIGKPSTLVELPNGDNFDKRTIMVPQHGKNNWLGVVANKTYCFRNEK